MDDPVILTVNSGSSSIKLAVYSLSPDRRLALITHLDREGRPTEAPMDVLGDLLESLASADRPNMVSHRIVHGGPSLLESCLIDAHVEREIERAGVLAPLHNPVALEWIAACRTVFGPDIAQVACFDTALFAELPAVTRLYPLPREIVERWGIRRYGFHGLAHQSMLAQLAERRPDLTKAGRIVTLQLGAGSSAAAFAGERPIDTSMGFSPTEGLMMATRSGDVDPGILLYLLREARLAPDQLDDILNQKSGLVGVSGSANMKRLLASDAPADRRAVDMYCYRVVKYVGAYAAALGGLDALVFGGGVGVRAPAIRRKIVMPLRFLGLVPSEAENAAASGRSARISASSSRVDIWAMEVDEGAQLAREAMRVAIKGQ